MKNISDMNHDISGGSEFAGYKRIPNRANTNCFGCSPNNEHGLQMKFYTNDEEVVSMLVVPDHLCGWNDLVHGGVISTILDEIMSWTSIYLLRRFIFTKSMTVDFLRPITVGQQLKIQGRLVERVSEREAKIEGLLYNEKGKLCAKSTGTFALFTLEAMKNKMMVSSDVLSDFEEILDPNFKL